MNNHVYRLVFNRARGILMAVSEAVKSQGKSTQETKASATGITIGARAKSTGFMSLTIKPMAFSLLLVLGQVMFIGTAQADIIADPSAPKPQQLIILSAPNDVPVVNIQTPSAAGVSRNTYSQFDVNSYGAILNNSRNNVST